MNREQLDSAMWDLVHRAQALVGEARTSIQNGYVCDSLLFGDDAACAALRANVATLDARVLELASLVGQVTSKRDQDLAENDADRLQEYADLITSEAATLVQAARTSAWAEYARDTLAQFVAFVATVASATLTAVGDVAGAATGGLISGLGPWGTLAVAALVYLAFLRGRA